MEVNWDWDSNTNQTAEHLFSPKNRLYQISSPKSQTCLNPCLGALKSQKAVMLMMDWSLTVTSLKFDAYSMPTFLFMAKIPPLVSSNPRAGFQSTYEYLCTIWVAQQKSISLPLSQTLCMGIEKPKLALESCSSLLQTPGAYLHLWLIDRKDLFVMEMVSDAGFGELATPRFYFFFFFFNSLTVILGDYFWLSYHPLYQLITSLYHCPNSKNLHFKLLILDISSSNYCLTYKGQCTVLPYLCSLIFLMLMDD